MAGSQSSRGVVHRVQSLGNAKPTLLNYVNPITKKDSRSKTQKNATAMCPECQGWVRTRKYNRNIDRYDKDCNRLISNHRIGGGTYNVMKGDVLCKGAGKVIRD